MVGLLADPGLPSDIARHLAGVLPDLLSRQVSDRVSWEVRTARDPFEATPEPDRIIDKARRRVEDTDWNIAIGITDVPLQTGNGAVVAEVGRSDRVSLLSLPALGGLFLRWRARDVAVAIVGELTPGLATAHDEADAGVGESPDRRDGDPADVTVGSARLRRVTTSPVTARRVTPSDTDIGVEMVVGRGRGTMRLLAGMVRANRPWRLTVGLSTALAAAATGSAFGLLYSNVWELGAALQPWRLALATVIAVAVFVAWLVIGHGLWEREARARPLGRLLNPGTLLTVTSGVLLFSAILLGINLAVAGMLIPPTYLAEVVGDSVGVTDYLRVALMASILGLVAGAVGSGLEDDQTVRRAAYSNREAERRELLDAGRRAGQGSQPTRPASSA